MSCYYWTHPPAMVISAKSPKQYIHWIMTLDTPLRKRWMMGKDENSDVLQFSFHPLMPDKASEQTDGRYQMLPAGYNVMKSKKRQRDEQQLLYGKKKKARLAGSRHMGRSVGTVNEGVRERTGRKTEEVVLDHQRNKWSRLKWWGEKRLDGSIIRQPKAPTPQKAALRQRAKRQPITAKYCLSSAGLT